MEQRWKLFSGGAILLSLILLATPRLIPICTDLVATAKGSMVYMKCHYTYQAEYLVGLGALILSGALYFAQGEARRILSVIYACLGLVVILLPQSWVIGICANPAMACNHTTPFMYAWGGLMILLGALMARYAQSTNTHTPSKPDAKAV